MTTRAFGLMAVGMVLLASACSSNNSSGVPATGTTTQQTTTAPPASSGSGVTITMVDFSFKPSSVTASTSEDIVLTNTGSAVHNFSIDQLHIDQDVQPGQSVTLKAPGSAVPAGTYDFFCKFHKSQGMVGTLNATSP